jgi:hypothetical protein
MTTRMPALTVISPDRNDAEGPMIFLAGPIQGAADWQSGTVRSIREASGAVHIASPRRSDKELGEFSDDMYNEQVDWEHHYLARAMRHGVIMFWLAREAEHVCDRVYAQTTRFELGEVVALHRTFGVHVVIGFDEGFSNTRYLRRTIARKTPGIVMVDSLDAAWRAALDIALAARPNKRIPFGDIIA